MATTGGKQANGNILRNWDICNGLAALHLAPQWHIINTNKSNKCNRDPLLHIIAFKGLTIWQFPCKNPIILKINFHKLQGVDT